MMRQAKGTYLPLPIQQTDRPPSSPLVETFSPRSKFASTPGMYTAPNSPHHYSYASSRPSSSSDSSISGPASSILSRGDSHYDPQVWDAKILASYPEADDSLHNPNPRQRLSRGHIFTVRGIANLGCILIMVLCIVGLFVGYPVINFAMSPPHTKSFGVNATGQIPQLIGNWGLIDTETPQDAHVFTSFMDGSDWQLVFSDEFNTEGRSFYPGDDPYWEAADLQYWATGNINWYSPDAITTRNGSLEITFSKEESHGLDYKGGMLASWNKFCFTGGMVLASVTLPGKNNVSGLWPAVWTLGNLGRVGYGATLEGMWPYSYDTCDVGAVANQSLNNQPPAAHQQGPHKNESISGLPGQRLSRCTCAGEEHPGPKHKDGTFVGRSAPEIDLFEAQVDGKLGAVSQSGQWAPFNDAYLFKNDSTGVVVDDPTITIQNSYSGGPLQQATSFVSETNQICYQLNEECFSTYGVEYKPGYDADGAYISWISDNKQTWTLKAAGVGADDTTGISARPVSQEPMYLIANLGMSSGFNFLDFDHLEFPAVMKIDWIRVYQPSGSVNVGCDPKGYPTMNYITNNLPAYSNPNLTTWTPGTAGYGKGFPKNSIVDNC